MCQRGTVQQRFILIKNQHKYLRVIDEITFVNIDEIQVKNQFGSLSASRDNSCTLK